MNLESHIAHVCKIAYMNLHNMRNVLTDQSAAKLFHALISTRIDYCNSIFKECQILKFLICNIFKTRLHVF